MAALHELSIRLSVLGRSLPLSTIKSSSSGRAGLSGRQRSSAIRDSLPFLSRPAAVGSCRHHSEGNGIATSTGLLWPSGIDRHHGGELQLSCWRRSRLDILTSVIRREYHPPAVSAFGSNGSSEGEGTQVLLGDIVDANDRPGRNSRDVAEVQKDVKEQGPKDETIRYSNYLAMSDQELFAKCKMDTYKASGPGGQHRNKTESAVRLTHIPTGLVAQASEDRSQHNNRSMALVRLRQTIALEVRDSVELNGYKPSPEFMRILPAGGGGRKKGDQKIGPNHPEFVQGMKCLIDLLWATGGSVSDAAKVLGLTTGALSKLITSNGVLWQSINRLRAAKGLKPLR